jgi:hypothetical protein
VHTTVAIERTLQRPIRELRDALANDEEGVLLWLILQEMAQVSALRKRRAAVRRLKEPESEQLEDERAEYLIDLHTLLLKDKLKGKEAKILGLLKRCMLPTHLNAMRALLAAMRASDKIASDNDLFDIR